MNPNKKELENWEANQKGPFIPGMFLYVLSQSIPTLESRHCHIEKSCKHDTKEDHSKVANHITEEELT